MKNWIITTQGYWNAIEIRPFFEEVCDLGLISMCHCTRFCTKFWWKSPLFDVFLKNSNFHFEVFTLWKKEFCSTKFSARNVDSGKYYGLADSADSLSYVLVSTITKVAEKTILKIWKYFVNFICQIQNYTWILNQAHKLS